MTDSGRQRGGWRRRLVRGAALATVGVAALLLVWLRGALWNHWVRFPRQEAALTALRSARQPVGETAGWQDYRGILHSHSELSHDSEVPFEEILRVLQRAGLDFIALSDHCDEGRADFDRQWRGLREGKLFLPGYEMKEGCMPFGAAPGTVLSNRTELAVLARQVIDQGGVLFFAHPEEPRAWDLPQLSGMEIYNIHSNFKAFRGGLRALLPDLLVNQRRYPDQVFRLIFQRPTAFLDRWDELNRSRHLTGIAGNDCHQNTGFRGFCTSSNTIRIEDTSPETIAEFKLHGLSRPLARLAFGPLTAGRRLFHFQLDPYERMARFVNTHVLASTLTEPAILDSLRAGRVYVGFDSLADSTGFLWLAESGLQRVVLGESLAWSGSTRLRALSPVPCRFSVLRHGQLVGQGEGRSLEFTPPGPGKYRVEAEVRVVDEWVPWVYANPIELR